MVNLKGTWLHDEAFPAFNKYVYRFVSLLQHSTVYSVTRKVIQRYGYVLLDRGCEDAAERLLLWLILSLLYIADKIIWSFKTQWASCKNHLYEHMCS